MQTLQVVDSDVATVTEAVWASVLGLELERGMNCTAPVASTPFAAIVHITGAWNGAVLLRCGAAMSTRLASILLGAEEPTHEDCCDALAEVAQLVGGNIKSLVPGPSKRSLSTVFDGDVCQMRIPDSRPIADVEFRSEGDPVRVTVYQQFD